MLDTLSTLHISEHQRPLTLKEARPAPAVMQPDAPGMVVEQSLKRVDVDAENQEVPVFTLGDAANSGTASVAPTSVRSPSPIEKAQVKRIPSRVLFAARQEWEGVVIDIEGNEFSAKLTDLSGAPTAPQEEASFSLDLVSEDDMELLAPGAVFRWSIGYQRMPGGTKQLTSQIVFRRLPQWTERDLREADRLAAEFQAHFNGGRASQAG